MTDAHKDSHWGPTGCESILGCLRRSMEVGDHFILANTCNIIVRYRMPFVICMMFCPNTCHCHNWCIMMFCPLTHWGRVTHICVGKLTIIGSDNGLSPGRRQAIIWNNAGLLLIEPIGTNFSEISIGIQRFSFKEMHLNMSSAKWRPFCLGLNELKAQEYTP